MKISVLFYCSLNFNTLACHSFEELTFEWTWNLLGVKAELMIWCVVVSGFIYFMNNLKTNVPVFYVLSFKENSFFTFYFSPDKKEKVSLGLQIQVVAYLSTLASVFCSSFQP